MQNFVQKGSLSKTESGGCGETYRRYHFVMNATLPKSVGLGGDGDEIFAINDVEHAFGVKLDYADASNWRTAGDVFASLCKALPPDIHEESDLWVRFTKALSAETGVDPASIERDSPLLSQSPLWLHAATASAMVLITATIGVSIVAWALR